MFLIIFCCQFFFPSPRHTYTPPLSSLLIISPSLSPFRCITQNKNLSYWRPSVGIISVLLFPCNMSVFP